ncbi:MAG: hypothetical protein FJX73_10065 [Armatimonadetes bacterium]|nr:hypothetical protein [Armatimonadota bacterium]
MRLQQEGGDTTYSQTFDRFPLWMGLVGIGVSVATYILGAYILFGFGMAASILYIGYCAAIEISVLRGSCVHCYYYGKVCGLARGRICSLFFRRGSPEKFLERRVSIRTIIPDLLVAAVPLIGGVGLLVMRFNWMLLISMLLIVLLATAGNALVRGSLACRHCAQRDLGCPAERFFVRQRV